MKKLLIVMVIAGIAVAAMVFKKKPAVAPENGSVTGSPVFCTQDAKRCPDGSYVGRQGPNCEFAPCPAGSPSVDKSASPTASPKVTESAAPKSQIVTIAFANGIATPSVVNIKVGDTVKFINNDSITHWPASGVHPTHQICPGFDALRGLNSGESYSFTFNTAKTCPWHDHLNLGIKGQVIVGN